VPCPRVYFKLKSFFAMEPLPDAAWRTMMEWQAKIQRYGGYVELDMLGAQVRGSFLALKEARRRGVPAERQPGC
jgi:hypothetical protein